MGADGGWDEDAHPRGPDGKFGGGGGKSDAVTWAAARAGGSKPTSASAKGDLKAWATEKSNQRADAAKKAAEPKEVRAPREWTGAQMAGKENETWKDHYVDKDGNKGTPGAHPDEGGKPTAERAAMHEREFIKPAFEGKQTAAALGMQPHAILTMGGPASGKGTILSKLEKSGLDKSKYVHVDPDEVKGKLPEYKASVPHPEHTDRHGEHVPGEGGAHGDGTGPTFKGAAAQVHEESSAVAKQIEARAIAGGHNVIIDGTGGNAAGMVARIKDLEAKGYPRGRASRASRPRRGHQASGGSSGGKWAIRSRAGHPRHVLEDRQVDGSDPRRSSESSSLRRSEQSFGRVRQGGRSCARARHEPA